jgi:dienelactone hydrolase
MSVTSCKTTVIPFIGFDSIPMAVIVKTADQSRKKQPLLWIVHGSGGVSSSDEIWMEAGLSRGYSVAWVDHYGPRGIYKIMHVPDEPKYVWALDMAEDVRNAHGAILANRNLVPFLDVEDVSLVGFSSGGSAGMYLTTFGDTNLWLRKVGALYPGLWPITDRMLECDGSRIRIYVGADDDWTPARHAVMLAERVPDLSVRIWPGVVHSFSKPGSGGYYDSIPRHQSIPYPIPCSLADVRANRGIYRELTERHLGEQMGVRAMYDQNATEMTMRDFFGS